MLNPDQLAAQLRLQEAKYYQQRALEAELEDQLAKVRTDRLRLEGSVQALRALVAHEQSADPEKKGVSDGPDAATGGERTDDPGPLPPS